MVKRKIVILGAGFAGIRAVQDLSRKLTDSTVEIVLVDSSEAHVFKADLYEVATAFNKKITDKCLTELKKTVATPIRDLIDSKKVRFVRDKVVHIGTDSKEVVLRGGGVLNYDCLVVALGSTANYFGIKGLEDHAFAMKTTEDAIKINCHLNQLFYERRSGGERRDVYLVVGGGGATGVETVAELSGFVRLLARKCGVPLDRVHVCLIEGSGSLIGLDTRGTGIILKRLVGLGVKVYLESFVSSVSEREVTLKKSDGGIRTLPYDILIWTGGVKVNPLVSECLGDKSVYGAIKVNPFLQTEIDRYVFAAGDNAYFSGADGKPLPMLAQTAYQEGALIAENVINIMYGQPLKPFIPGKLRLIVPLGGKYALFKSGKIFLKGFLPWVLKRVVYFKYALSILPFWKACGKFFRSTKVFVEND